MVTVGLRRRGTDDEPEHSVIPLSATFDIPHQDFDIVDIGAPELCVAYHAVAIGAIEGVLYFGAVMDWRGVGLATTSKLPLVGGRYPGKELGGVLRTFAARSGVPEVNQGDNVPDVLFEREGEEVADALFGSTVLTEILQYDAKNEPDDGGPKSLWALAYITGRTADIGVGILSCSPESAGNRSRNETLTDLITDALSVEAFGKKRPDRAIIADGGAIIPSDATTGDSVVYKNAQKHDQQHGGKEWCNCLNGASGPHPVSDHTSAEGMNRGVASEMVSQLTPLERDVLLLKLSDKSNRHIAETLGKSERYVGQLIKSAAEKLPGDDVPSSQSLRMALGTA